MEDDEKVMAPDVLLRNALPELTTSIVQLSTKVHWVKDKSITRLKPEAVGRGDLLIIIVAECFQLASLMDRWLADWEQNSCTYGTTCYTVSGAQKPQASKKHRRSASYHSP